MSKVTDINHIRRRKDAMEGGDSKKWTVRDALQAMVDDMDSGEIPEATAVLITYRTHENGRDTYGYYSAGVNRLEVGGLLLEGVGLVLVLEGDD